MEIILKVNAERSGVRHRMVRYIVLLHAELSLRIQVSNKFFFVCGFDGVADHFQGDAAPPGMHKVVFFGCQWTAELLGGGLHDEFPHDLPIVAQIGCKPAVDCAP